MFRYLAFTTSGAPTNHVCTILARFHDVPLGDTLCRVLWFGSVGLYPRLPSPVLTFWFSSCLGGGSVLLGFVHSVHISPHFWPGLTVALLRSVLAAIFPGLRVCGLPSTFLCCLLFCLLYLFL